MPRKPQDCETDRRTMILSTLSGAGIGLAVSAVLVTVTAFSAFPALRASVMSLVGVIVIPRPVLVTAAALLASMASLAMFWSSSRNSTPSPLMYRVSSAMAIVSAEGAGTLAAYFLYGLPDAVFFAFVPGIAVLVVSPIVGLEWGEKHAPECVPGIEG